MTADLLREAAAKIRERAQDATTHTPWQLLGPDDEYARPWTVASTHEAGERTHVCSDARHAGEHIASWHPAVALAVADWLDQHAEEHGPSGRDECLWEDAACRAIAVARAYLNP